MLEIIVVTAKTLWQIVWRTAITLACVWTLQNIINQEGYRVGFGHLLVAAIAVIVGVRVWMPFSKQE